MDNQEIRDTILESIESALEAQLRAIRRLRKGAPPSDMQPRESMSKIDMAYDILASEGEPLHISAIIDKILHRYGVQVDRESLVSAITKRVVRSDRFERTGKNTFVARREQSK